MAWVPITKSIIVGFVVLLVGVVRSVYAETPQDKYHRAYYLEHETRDVAGAAKLYAEVASESASSSAIREQANARLAGCREELAANDLAKLMPPNTLAFVEVRNPSGQLSNLLDQLGLLGPARAGDAAKGANVAVSPALIEGVLGMRGAAVALTGFDPLRGIPSGVAILHPGDLQVVRGLIETGLPAGGKRSEPIAGFVTFAVDDKVFVTLTARLVIAATDRGQIEGVVRRLSGNESKSFAASEDMKAALDARGEGLLFACVNARAVAPLLKGAAAASGAKADELAMMQALLDPDHLRSVHARAGVEKNALALDMSIQYDKGHRSVLFHLPRTPKVSPELLKRIPSGCAAFLVGALNEPPSRFSGETAKPTDPLPPVTALDLGRELFANIYGLALFALPPGETTDGPPVPDIAAVFMVGDSAKSAAIWTQALGLLSLASGGSTAAGDKETVAEREVRSFSFGNGFRAYLAVENRAICLSSSKAGLSRALLTGTKDKSITDDPVFAQAVERFSSTGGKGLVLHPARCAAIARRFVPDEEFAQVQPWIEPMKDTVAALMVAHSEETFHVSARVDALPKIGHLISQVIEKERADDRRREEFRQAERHGDWNRVLELADARLAQQPSDASVLEAKFRALAIGRKDRSEAGKVLDRLIELYAKDNGTLNNLAWELLTDERLEGKFADAALRVAKRCNEETDFAHWAFVDTLARAMFETGNRAEAIRLQKKAIELHGGRDLPELTEALARYERARESVGGT